MSTLPTGTVTFLFADVEGSTRLAHDLGAEWQPVLADIRKLLRQAVSGSSGNEVDSRGDELFAVFATADDAMAAACDAQRLLGGHHWPAPVRVRIGLHTGTAALGEDGYVGVDVHRAFRIASAGHGGQIIASEAAATALTPHRTFRDLGLWLLPDLPEPERIFQLDEPGFGGDFPALRARPGATPLRVVLADDSVLLREGSRGCSRRRGSRSWPSRGTRRTCSVTSRCTSPTSPWSTSACRRPRPTRGSSRRRRSATSTRGSACSSSPSSSSPPTRWSLLSESAESLGYLLKDRVADISEFSSAVRRVAEGGSALDPAVVSELVGRHRRDDPIEDLSPREREVLELMAEGRSNQAIAERLFVTLRAVEKHVTSIFVKLRLPRDGRGPQACPRRARAAAQLNFGRAGRESARADPRRADPEGVASRPLCSYETPLRQSGSQPTAGLTAAQLARARS